MIRISQDPFRIIIGRQGEGPVARSHASSEIRNKRTSDFEMGTRLAACVRLFNI